MKMSRYKNTAKDTDWDTVVADLAFPAWLEIDWTPVLRSEPRERLTYACEQIKHAVPMLREVSNAELGKVIAGW
jgi:hypothetical protein